MSDENKAFFAFVAIAVPLANLALHIFMPFGIAIAVIALATACGNDRSSWERLGSLLSKRELTLAVLIGGTLLVLAPVFAM